MENKAKFDSEKISFATYPYSALPVCRANNQQTFWSWQ